MRLSLSGVAYRYIAELATLEPQPWSEAVLSAQPARRGRGARYSCELPIEEVEEIILAIKAIIVKNRQLREDYRKYSDANNMRRDVQSLEAAVEMAKSKERHKGEHATVLQG